VNRSFFPVFFLALTLIAGCKSVPEPPEITSEPPAAEETGPAGNGGADDMEPPQTVGRAEETVKPLDTPVDAALTEPDYDMSGPEVADLDRLPELIQDGEPIALDEAEARLPNADSAPQTPPVPPAEETAAAPPPAEEAPAPPAAGETVASPSAEETIAPPPAEEPPPPPPPAAARRAAELPVRPPAVDSGPVRPLPELTARNPPVETGGAAKPAASRVIRVNTGQLFEIPFEGTGWIYTGEENSKKGVNYASRRVNGGTQTFAFRAEKEGDYTLKFYKQDFLQDYYTNEYVHVIVENPVAGDSIAENLAEGLIAENGMATAPAEDSYMRADEGDAGSSPEDLLRRAREAAAAQKHPEAIALLDKFKALRPAMNDEALWLYGQSFEAASPARDIRSAIDAYSSLTRDYPQSRYYQNARNRIAFLNRFYFNIR
jgi:hypothetical protein